MRKIEWTPDGIDSIDEILEYYKDKAGENIPNTIYDKIIKEIELLESEKIKAKRTQELADIGIFDVYEFVIKPWKVCYKISGDDKKVYILFVLDGRTIINISSKHCVTVTDTDACTLRRQTSFSVPSLARNYPSPIGSTYPSLLYTEQVHPLDPS